MKILGYSVLHGPNYYSPYPVIIMKLDLEDKVNYTSATIEGFNDMLLDYIPTLHKHYCSYGREGGFVLRLKEGTMFGHIVEHVCLELQNIAEMEVNFGKTRESTEEGVFNVVYSFMDEVSGKYAGRIAVELVDSIVNACLNPDKEFKKYPLGEKISELKEIESENYIGPSTKAMVDEAKYRGIPFIRLNRFNLIQLGQGKYQKKIEATITSNTSVISMDIAKNPEYFSKELEAVGIPCSHARYVYEYEEALEYLQETGNSIILKPSDHRNGIGISLDIKTPEELKKAFDYASQYGNEFVAEKYITGSTYRVLVVDGKVTAVARRHQALIKGDGVSTIKTLIDKENAKAERNNREIPAPLSQIKINDATLRILNLKGLTIDSALPKDEELPLHMSCKQGLGGYSIDVTDWVHTQNKDFAERSVKIAGLDIAGIDIIAPTLREPITDTGGAIIGVNIAPDFRIHTAPLKGSPRNVAIPVFDMLFSKHERTVIPVVSITGTCGKTMVSRMVSHILTLRGFDTGLACSDGLYFRDDLVLDGERTKRDDIITIFKDPKVDFAVLETTMETITNEGLGYQRADVGVILNISEEYYENTGWRDVDDISYVKLLVAEQIEDWGIAVLNADDEILMNLYDEIRSEAILFTTKEDNPIIRKHLTKGYIAVTYNKGEFFLRKGNNVSVKIASVYEVPVTHDGKSISGIYNTLASISTLYAISLTLDSKENRIIIEDDIRIGITSFSSSFNSNPLRLNQFSIKGSRILLDSPCNPVSFDNYASFIKTTGNNRRVGVFYNLKHLSERTWGESLKTFKGLFKKIYIVKSESESEEYINSIKEYIGKTGISSYEDIKIITDGNDFLKQIYNEEKDSTICICSKDKNIIPKILLLKEEFDPFE